MRKLIVLIAACALAALPALSVTSTAVAQKSRTAPLRLKSGVVLPTHENSISAAPMPEAEANARGYYLV